MVGDLLMTFSHVQAYTNNFYTHIGLIIICWVSENIDLSADLTLNNT